jgi:LmbE family N-acetylglucosaminyl deacetylase
VTATADGPRLDQAGTNEAAWTTARLCQLPGLQLGRYGRSVVVAPHPDDEVLAAGGLMQRLSSRGTALTVVSVTDGEASHPASPTHTPMVVADRRADERYQALRFLGLGGNGVIRLGLPDGAVTDDAEDLVACLGQLLGPDVLCLAPWEHDGHPDHDATGRAAAVACVDTGATLLRYPVWTWHWAAPGDQRVPWARARSLALSPVEVTRKRWATRSFRSQIAPLSHLPGDEAILAPGMLAHFDRRCEVFLA